MNEDTGERLCTLRTAEASLSYGVDESCIASKSVVGALIDLSDQHRVCPGRGGE